MFKLGPDSQIGRGLAQNYGIFCQFRNKLAIIHTIDIKWKEKYDAVAVDCHNSLSLCGDRMKKSLPKKKSLLPGSHLGQNFSP